MTAPHEMAAAFEAILFTATEPVPRERLLALFDPSEQESAAAALAEVVARYGDNAREGTGHGVVLEEVAGGLRLVTRPELHGWLRRFYEAAGANKLSVAALETLAIVAYRQPITAPEVQDLRGVSPVGVLKTLLDRRLLRIAGRKAVVGKPFLYATTREFLVHFGLGSLDDLPPLEEFEETFGEGGELALGRRLGERDRVEVDPIEAGDASEALDAVEARGATGAMGAGGEFGGYDDVDREETIRREAAEIEDAELVSAARAAETEER